MVPFLLNEADFSSLCTEYKKVFAHEHILYTSRELSTHFSTGDPVKDISLTGFTGHPKCKFCVQSFYSEDELTQHNREKHERCHVCDSINSHRGIPDPQPRYFIDYNELWKHFQREHYPCGAAECLEQKFVVFESEIDLKAHVMEAHMESASKAELRDIRKVEVNFQYNTPAGGSARRRREEERPHREVDISSLPRDEQAYYRIQQAQRERSLRQNVAPVVPPSREQFPPLGAPSPKQSTSVPVRPVENFPPLQGNSMSRNGTTTMTPSHLPSDVSRRHATVLEKACRLLNNDTEKLAQFKAQVSSFLLSESSAAELIDTLWDIFQAKIDEFGKLITMTADLFDYDAKTKRTELLRAWNDWKIQMQAANSVALTELFPQQSQQRSRILRVKSSAQGRASTSTQSVWNRIEAVATSRPVPSTSSAPLTQRFSTLTAQPPRSLQTPPTQNTLVEFPSLPTVKPREKIVLNAAAVAPRPGNQWSVQQLGSTPASEMSDTTVKTKGKKKGKTVLFHVG
jgi:hypothetical protein